MEMFRLRSVEVSFRRRRRSQRVTVSQSAMENRSEREQREIGGVDKSRRETEVDGVPAGAKHRRPVSSRRTSFPCLSSEWPRSSDFAASHVVPRTTGSDACAIRSRCIASFCSARPLVAADFASPLSAPTLAPAWERLFSEVISTVQPVLCGKSRNLAF